MKKLLVRIVCTLLVCCQLMGMGVVAADLPMCDSAIAIRVAPRPLEGTPKPGEEPKVQISEYDAQLIAKTLYGEYRGPDKLQQAAVAWCILNRTDHYGESVEDIVTAPNQFMGYSKHNPVDEELYATAVDVLRRHALEKAGMEEVGRILPKEYMWFAGDGQKNHFRNKYSSGQRWDWSLPNPYIEM